MDITVWLMQGLLATFFLLAGFNKISSSKQKHVEDGHLKPGASVIPLRILGIFEMLGSVGIIIPCLTGFAPVLTPIAAVCFCIIMLGAFVVHIQRKQYKFLPLTIVVIALGVVVAYYRFMTCTMQ